VARRAALIAIVVLIACSCRRKAPGPEECRSHALQMFRLEREEDLGGRTRREIALRDQVDALTRECLVVPYDRQFLRCAQENGGSRRCRTAFDDRRRAGRSGYELTR
jgi:hypothetical protein